MGHKTLPRKLNKIVVQTSGKRQTLRKIRLENLIVMGSKFVFPFFIACGLAYMLYVPFPEACDFPILVKIYFSVAEGFKYLGAVIFMFGGKFSAAFDAGGFIPDTSGLVVTDSHIAEVKVRIYRPLDFAKTVPGSAMIYFHGGGWTTGSIESHAVQTVAIAKETGFLVVVPEYRLSPEHPFPAAFDDCLAVTQEILREAKKYDVNPKKIVLAGDSAGGNLAAAVSLEIGRKISPNPICMANLIYPSLQMVNLRLPSYLQNPNGPLLDHWFITSFLLSYIGFGNNTELAPLLLQNAHMEGSRHPAILERVSEKWVPKKYKKRPPIAVVEMIPEEGIEILNANKRKIQEIVEDVRLSVIAADDSLLKLLPNMHVVTCEYDPLRDDGIILHERMKNLGLRSSLVNWEFCAHGLFNMYRVFKYERHDRAVQDMLKVITKAVAEC